MFTPLFANGLVLLQVYFVWVLILIVSGLFALFTLILSVARRTRKIGRVLSVVSIGTSLAPFAVPITYANDLANYARYELLLFGVFSLLPFVLSLGAMHFAMEGWLLTELDVGLRRNNRLKCSSMSTLSDEHRPQVFGMHALSAGRWVLGVLVNPGWAPLGVVILHLLLAEFGLTERFDRLLHFLGGAAIAYFVFGLINRAPGLAAGIPSWFLYLFAFTAVCTVATFWEFGEFASDQFMGTAIQRGLTETIRDLFYGVLGALACLVITALLRIVRTRPARS